MLRTSFQGRRYSVPQGRGASLRGDEVVNQLVERLLICLAIEVGHVLIEGCQRIPVEPAQSDLKAVTLRLLSVAGKIGLVLGTHHWIVNLFRGAARGKSSVNCCCVVLFW